MLPQGNVKMVFNVINLGLVIKNVALVLPIMSVILILDVVSFFVRIVWKLNIARIEFVWRNVSAPKSGYLNVMLLMTILVFLCFVKIVLPILWSKEKQKIMKVILMTIIQVNIM